MTTCPVLTTERLVMRPFRADDVEPYHAAMSSPEVRAAFHLPDDYARMSTWTGMCTFAGLWELKGLGQWALEDRTTGRFVGRAGLYWRAEDDWPGVEVGWLLDPGAWGMGYATEAAGRALRYGFEEVGQDTLYSVILPENTRSQAVARRLGFEPGVERTLSFYPAMPHVVWRLDRATWVAGLSAG